MSREIRCYFLVPTDRAREFVRIYGGECPERDGRIHEAQRSLAILPYEPEAAIQLVVPEKPMGDPWPEACDHCGKAFVDLGPVEAFTHQAGPRRLYRRSDTDAHSMAGAMLMTLQDAPVGAMWDAPWYLEVGDQYRGPDGRCLVLRTPGGDWIMDGPSSNGQGWSRQGEPPNITASPSIGMGRADGKGWDYHGWLRNGVLVEC